MILGITPHGVTFAEKVLYKKSGINFQGFCDDNAHIFTGNHFPVLGKINQVLEFAQSGQIDTVYIAIPLTHQVKNLINELTDTPVSVQIILPGVFTNKPQSRLIEQFNIYETAFGKIKDKIKRIEDIILGSIIMLIIALPMLLIAAIIKLTSQGPIFYKQNRYGLNGEIIKVWKFRTMSVCEQDNAFKQATKNDTRVTWIGRFLRNTSLDELPQFINVLQGNMSIVGPRPHPIPLNEKHRKLIAGYMLRHQIKPGITGWAQVNGWRGETDTLEKMQKRVEFDFEYICNWSLLLDFKIILLTLYKGFFSKNAY